MKVVIDICGASGHNSDIDRFGYCTMCGKSKEKNEKKGNKRRY